MEENGGVGDGGRRRRRENYNIYKLYVTVRAL